MISITTDLIKEFKEYGITLIPEASTNSKTSIPCVTYFERDNSDYKTGNTVGYSDISYTIQIWDKNYKNLIQTSLQIDDIMKKLGFSRISANEQMIDGLHRKILIYNILLKENFN